MRAKRETEERKRDILGRLRVGGQFLHSVAVVAVQLLRQPGDVAHLYGAISGTANERAVTERHQLCVEDVLGVRGVDPL